MQCSRARNDSFLVPREEVPGSNPGQGKQLVLFKVSSKLAFIYSIIYIFIYIFKGKVGMRTHSRHELYLMIGQLVNGKFQEIQDQILLVRRQTKEE